MPTMDFTDVEQVFLGGDEIQEVYCMGDLVWQKKKGEKIVASLSIWDPWMSGTGSYTYSFTEPSKNRKIIAVYSFVYNGRDYIGNLELKPAKKRRGKYVYELVDKGGFHPSINFQKSARTLEGVELLVEREE